PQRGERRELGRFQDDRTAGGEGRTDLPPRHHHRVVPRRDEPRYAEGLAAQHRRVTGQIFAGRLRAGDSGAGGEEAEGVGQEFDLGRGRRDGLADVLALDADEFVGVGLDGGGEAVQGESPLRRRGAGPSVEGVGGRLDGTIDVGWTGRRHFGHHLTRRRV